MKYAVKSVLVEIDAFFRDRGWDERSPAPGEKDNMPRLTAMLAMKLLYKLWKANGFKGS